MKTVIQHSLTKPEVKQWVKALRSGKYKQGQMRLKGQDEDGSLCYCCLGVLAEVCPDRGRDDDEGSLLSSNEEISGIPHQVQDWLATMNDGGTADINGRVYNRPRSFKQIANFIERNF